MAERPDAGSGVQAPARSIGRRSSTACPRCYGAMLASPDLPRAGGRWRCASAPPRARRCRRRSAERWTDHFGVEILDGIGSTEMLHIFLSNRPGEVRYGTTGKPVPGYQLAFRRRGRQRRGHRRARRAADRRPDQRDRLLEQPRANALDLPRRVDAHRRQVQPRRGRLLHLRRPLRRHAQGGRNLRLAVRGRGGAG